MDPSESDRTEEPVSGEESRLDACFELGVTGMAIASAGTRWLRINPRMCEMLARPGAELLAGSWTEAIHPDDLPACVERHGDLLTGASASFHAEARLLRPDQRTVYAELHMTALRSGDGGLDCILVQALDVTERRTAREALQKSQEQFHLAWESGLAGRKRAEGERKNLQEQLFHSHNMETVGRLAGGVAHDFNNLLTVVNGHSRLLLSRLPAGDPARESLEEIANAGERAAALTRQLLAISRRQVLQPQLLDVNATVTAMKRLAQRVAGERIRVATELEPGLGGVMADPGQLDQILLNLVMNAREAMPQGGSMTIATANAEVGEAYVANHVDARPGRFVTLSVSDTGAGMDAETRARIFEPFFTAREANPGLGLSTVYGSVKQSEGWISVDSEPGAGSTFSVYLPYVDPASEAAPRPPEAVSAPAGETVLVVDDRRDVRRLAAAVLQGLGYRTLEAADGEQALDVADAHPGPIHLLLTDLVMPGMAGRDLAARLRERRPDTRTIYMSGYDEATISAAEAGGPDGDVCGFLQKPFSGDDLAAKVRQALGATDARGPILVVDDDPGIRKLFRAILTGAGYPVIEAANGIEALEAMRKEAFALVITDLVMPEKEGIETIREIRRTYPRVRIAAMSGAFGWEFLKIASLLGAEATLLKPVSDQVLLSTVRRLMATGGQRA